ncbi:hypothetical protein NBRC3257_2979 [Gluconobacter thailandicus NBRC 3257]|uniref:Transposase n=1 Tax=Gluconobacter thailandicus NBRC 3257 TaxID=1381097 RepID=A0ABQ0J0J7_GLUTH|nr:hypothetical protein NBRC3257_2979 [Gluconobacter thailandicus NBRC 3257]
MNRPATKQEAAHQGVPRTCGDEPGSGEHQLSFILCSLHTQDFF